MAKWQVGNKDGYNANFIYDEDGNTVLEVFGVPLHTKVAEVPEERLVISRQIVAEHNAHEELVALAEEVAFHLYTLHDISRSRSIAQDVLKNLGKL